MSRISPWAILAVLLLAGAAVRGLYLSEAAGKPDFAQPGVDAGYHDYWARAIANGNWSPPHGEADPRIRSTPYFKPPGYPFFLATVYRLFGSSYLAPRIVQMLLGLTTCLLAFLFARRYFGDPVALIYAGIMALYWGFIYFEVEFLEPVLLVFLGVLSLLLLARLTEKFAWPWALAAGVALGLFAIVRAVILPFGIAALCWMLWISRGVSRPARRAAFAAFLLGIVLVVLPVTLRNQFKGHDRVLISANGGINLYLGNNPAANGISANTPELEGWNSFDYPQIVDDLGRRLGRPLSYSAASRWYARQATTFMRENPVRVLRLIGRKALLFWGPVEIGNEKQDAYERIASRALRMLPVTFPMIFALALVGVGMRFSKTNPLNPPAARVFDLVLLFVVTYFAVHLLFFVTGRYRLPIVPALMLPCSIAIHRLCVIAATRPARELTAWVAAVALVWLGVSRNWSGYQPSPGAWHLQRGVAWMKAGKSDRALREYEAALQAEPKLARAHNNMAILLQQEARIPEAIREYGMALSIQPDLQVAFVNLSNLLKQQESGGLDEAARRTLSEGWHVLGKAVLDQGRPDDAVAYYTKSLSFQPSNAATHNDMAIVAFVAGRYDEAWEHVRLCRQNGGHPHPDFVAALQKASPQQP